MVPLAPVGQKKVAKLLTSDLIWGKFYHDNLLRRASGQLAAPDRPATTALCRSKKSPSGHGILRLLFESVKNNRHPDPPTKGEEQ